MYQSSGILRNKKTRRRGGGELKETSGKGTHWGTELSGQGLMPGPVV